MTPDDFFAHALTAADGERRLPLSRMTQWEVAPFDQENLRVVPLRPPTVPEPARHDVEPDGCSACAARNEGVWLDDHWRLRRISGVGVPLVLMLIPRQHFDLDDLPDQLAAEMGVLSTHIARHVEALPNIARAHVYRIGDGGAHLHIWFFARPLGQGQMYGSWLPVWDDLLPEYPDDLAQQDAESVARALANSYATAMR
jgi:diadenosine tetraphosphate (Ap4A) HIT family hydrolase